MIYAARRYATVFYDIDMLYAMLMIDDYAHDA